MIALFYDEISKQYEEGELIFYKLDIDDLPAIGIYAEVCATPSFYIYMQGELKDHYIGSTKSKLTSLIDFYNKPVF